MKLKSKQRSYLRKIAQDLDPCVMVGKLGISDEVVKATEEGLNFHELIKVRFSDHKDERRELTDTLAEKCSAEIVGRIGHVAILFRQNQEPEKRKIKFKV